MNSTITAQQVYADALAYVYEDVGKDKDFQKYFLQFLNTIVAEARPYQNSLMERDGAGPYEIFVIAPTVKELSDVIPYNDNLVRTAFPYGVASVYFQDEGNNTQSVLYYNKYVEALQAIRVAIPKPMIDKY